MGKRETKSPIKNLSVRMAGQGLDEKMEDLFGDFIIYVFYALVLIFLAGFEWYRRLSEMPPMPWLFTVIAAGFTGYAAWKCWGIWNESKNVRLGRIPSRNEVVVYIRAEKPERSDRPAVVVLPSRFDPDPLSKNHSLQCSFGFGAVGLFQLRGINLCQTDAEGSFDRIYPSAWLRDFVRIYRMVQRSYDHRIAIDYAGDCAGEGIGEGRGDYHKERRERKDPEQIFGKMIWGKMIRGRFLGRCDICSENLAD